MFFAVWVSCPDWSAVAFWGLAAALCPAADWSVAAEFEAADWSAGVAVAALDWSEAEVLAAFWLALLCGVVLEALALWSELAAPPTGCA